MSTAVKVADLTDYRKQKEGPPVIAELEAGYTRTANAIQDQLCRVDLAGSQFQVLNAIIRSTYGFNKKADRVTNSYLAELTGLSDKAVRDALQVLVERHIIECEKRGMLKIVSVNKVVSDWVVTSSKTESRRHAAKQMHQKHGANAANQVRSKCTEEAEQMHQKLGANAPPTRSKCTDTKDNLLKTTNKTQTTSPPKGSESPLREGAAIGKGRQWGSEIDLAVAKRLLPLLKQTLGEDYREPNMVSWANEVRLMREQDNRQSEHIVALFSFAAGHRFWRKNIQSPQALRKQWGKLAAERNGERHGLNNNQQGITVGSEGEARTPEDWEAFFRSKGGGHA